MSQGDDKKAGPLTRFLAEDHRRLDGLLQAATAQAGLVEQGAYDRFRAGLLRHIGMEEKILLPAVQRLRSGEPLPLAAKLRLDHAAMATLLMPSPTADIVATLRDLLADHNALEEEPAGLYGICDDLVGSEAESLLAALQAAPEVAVMSHSDSPAVMNTLRRTLERAGYRLHGAEGDQTNG